MDDNNDKGPSQTTDFRTSIELANAYAVREKHGTQGDEKDMDRMGKLQVLKVNQSKITTTVQHTYKITSGNSNSYPSSALL
jgi:hypothetical protein